MATKKRTTTRRASAKTKAKKTAQARAPHKGERAHTESAQGIVYTSVLRELMASRLTKG
jgi:hypothetical protein